MKKRPFVILGVAMLILAGVVILSLWWLLLTRWGASFVVRRVVKDVIGAADYKIAGMEGSLGGHLVVKDLEISRFKGRLPQDFIVRISKIDVFFSAPFPKGLNVEIHNGRMILPDSGNIVLDGLLQDGVFEGNVFGKDIYLGDMSRFASISREWADLRGRVSRLECHLKISSQRFAVEGKAHVADIQGSRFVLQNCPLGFIWEYARSNGSWASVSVYGGQLGLPHAIVVLKPGRMIFADGPRDVRLDLKGFSQVEDVPISLHLQGTLKEPKLRLDSDSSLSQERLLVMLLTGKSWRSAEESVSQGGVSADLIKDTLDFLFFGGKVTDLAHALGVSDIHLEIDQNRKGVGLGTQITTRARLNYTVAQEDSRRDNVSVTQKAALIYKVADHLSVEGEKEMRSQQSITNTTQLPETNDAVFLKYKQNF
jgi:hypothetical protein